ncbi:OmpA family protein [Candidatus Magnetomonas plexicatena]|uniref:OmpA family protein n=1 Tax=Candidatus Magnetomonas plexicatena TaxID=2552947 RepID=UPI00403289B6
MRLSTLRTATAKPLRMETLQGKTMTFRKFKGNSKSSGDENLWLITMTDLMSLLLVCFVMFFIITRNKEKALEKAAAQMTLKTAQSEEKAVHAEAGALKHSESKLSNTVQTVVNSQESEQSKAASQTLNAVIKELNLEKNMTAELKNREVMLTIRDSVMFEPSKAEILQQSASMLDSVAEIIKKYPSLTVEIDGHTDNVPIKNSRYPSNWELSTARATSVLRYFTNVHLIEAARFYVKGSGAERPVVSNDTAEHKALNRRVEIRLRDLRS